VSPGAFEGADGRWFEAIAEHAGSAYLRYSFTKGSEQEVAFLADVLGLRPGERVLDVGCGPGRHAQALARRGIDVVGVDISPRFLGLAAESAEADFVRADARTLPFSNAAFAAAISLCQGGFGLVGADDGRVLAEMARCLCPGGRLAVSAFSSYFAVRHLEPDEEFDADAGINHEWTTVRSEAGDEAPFELWTSCFTPRELRLLARSCGLTVRGLWSVSPGDYARRPPDLDHPEWLMIAEPAADRVTPGE
jgi:SAM-dependent methyltransferase